MPLTQAYLIAAFARTGGDPRDCRLLCVDLFSEVEPTIASRDLFETVVSRGVGRDFESACRDAIASCARNPRQAWMLEYIAPRSRCYISQQADNTKG